MQVHNLPVLGTVPDELLARWVQSVDARSLPALSSVCRKLCATCRQLRATQLRLQEGQGKQLYVVPSSRGFPACRCLQYQLTGSNTSHSSGLHFALAYAALHMPLLSAVRINMVKEDSKAGISKARKKLLWAISACSNLRGLQDLAITFPGNLTTPVMAAAAQLTGLTALQLHSSSSSGNDSSVQGEQHLPAELVQLTQLRQLQVSGMQPQAPSPAAAAVACLPSSLTGLTFTMQLDDLAVEETWARQLQQCSNMCSLEVLLLPIDGEPQICTFLEDLAKPPPAVQQAGADMQQQQQQRAVVLPSLTRLVLRLDVAALETGSLISLSHEEADWLADTLLLFPSLQYLEVQQPNGVCRSLYLGASTLCGLVGCSQQLKELGWLCGRVGSLELPAGLTFPQLTKLRASYEFLSHAAGRALFPALQDLSICNVRVWTEAAPAVARTIHCTGLTSLTLHMLGPRAGRPVAPNAEYLNSIAVGLPCLRRLQLLLDECVMYSGHMGTWMPAMVSATGAFTQLTHLQLMCRHKETSQDMQADHMLSPAAGTAAQQKAHNLQLALAMQLPKLQQLQELVLSDMAGVSAAVVAGLLAQMPSLQLLQLEGCSEGLDIAQQQWAAGERVLQSSSEGAIPEAGAAAGVAGPGLAGPTANEAERIANAAAVSASLRLQLLRAGLRQGVRLEVTPSSWAEGNVPYW